MSDLIETIDAEIPTTADVPTSKQRAKSANKPKAKSKQRAKEDPTKVRLHPDHSRYTKYHEVRTASGRAAYDNSDAIATRLRGTALEDVYREVQAACDKAGRDVNLRAKYSHLNLGMQRMNLGNVLRGLLATPAAKAA